TTRNPGLSWPNRTLPQSGYPNCLAKVRNDLLLGYTPISNSLPGLPMGYPSLRQIANWGYGGVDRLSDLYKRHSPAALAKALFRMPTVGGVLRSQVALEYFDS